VCRQQWSYCHNVLSFHWGRTVPLRMLADMLLTTAQQRSTGQNLPSHLYAAVLWPLKYGRLRGGGGGAQTSPPLPYVMFSSRRQSAQEVCNYCKLPWFSMPTCWRWKVYRSNSSRKIWKESFDGTAIFGVSKKISPLPGSANELYRPSDRSLLAKLVPIFADGRCHMVSIPTAVI
jgi:hypothetical protein